MTVNAARHHYRGCRCRGDAEAFFKFLYQLCRIQQRQSYD
jgi:hypothetical protein